MKKRIVFNVTCNKYPFDLSFYCSNGTIIKNTKIYTNKSTVCVSANDCCLKVIARYNGQVNYKKIYLNNNSCQNICLGYSFNNILQKCISSITLLDKIYGFPVANAQLKFKYKN